jgi:hypothetical protein
VVHLNELNEKYADKGLVVLAVTNEARSAVDDFVEKNSPKYPIVIESTDSISAVGSHSFPTALLLGADGRVLQYGMANDQTIEQALESVKLMPEIPESLDGVRKELHKQEYANAIKKLQGEIDHGHLEDADVETAKKLVEWIEWFGNTGLENAGKDKEAGKVYEAYLAYDDLADTFKHHEIGDKAKAAEEEILHDKDMKLEVKAGEKLAKILEEIRDATPKKALKALAPLLTHKYEDTAAGKRAAAMAKDLEHDLSGTP